MRTSDSRGHAGVTNLVPTRATSRGDEMRGGGVMRKLALERAERLDRGSLELCHLGKIGADVTADRNRHW